MLIEIKNRFTGAVMFSYDVEDNNLLKTLVAAVGQGADLQGAYLQGAYLRGAYLQGAYLRGAYLQGAYLQGAYLRGAYEDVLEKNPIFINDLYWLVTITTKHLTIGCQHHTHEAWVEFSDKEIANMDSHASEFWSVWKTPLMAMAAAHKM